MSDLLESAKLELERFDKLSYANSLLLVERLEEFEAVKAERDRAMEACERLGDRLAKMRELQTGLLEKITHLKQIPRDIINNITPVYANSQNTVGVREGYELGGYVKYYKIEPHIIHMIKSIRSAKSKIQDG